MWQLADQQHVHVCSAQSQAHPSTKLRIIIMCYNGRPRVTMTAGSPRVGYVVNMCYLCTSMEFPLLGTGLGGIRGMASAQFKHCYFRRMLAARF
eukprot:scaffold103465_cov22-Prasinocladus_malaysianus.AAC.1